MSVQVRFIENVVSHYVGILRQGGDARKLLEEWGLGWKVELEFAEQAEEALVGLLADGVEEI